MFKAWNHEKDIARIKKLIRGSKQQRIRKSFRKFKESELQELISIAHAQLKAENMFEKGRKLILNQDDLRFTTPEIIGEYRTDRIFNSLGRIRIVDLCSSVGSQTISFARKLKHVISVEINERKFNYALKNVKTYDLRNTTLLNADIFDKKIIDKIKEFKPDAIFADPQRKEIGERGEEKETIGNIIKIYSKITPNLIIEIPPFINIKELRKYLNQDSKTKFSFEAEYLGVDFKLRRLTLYFSKLRKYDFSVIELTGNKYVGVNIDKYDEDDSIIKETDKILTYLIEPNPTLTRASLLHRFVLNPKIIERGHNTILTTDNLIKDEKIKDFFQQYKVLFYKKSKSYYDDEILNEFKELNAKYVVIKQSIQPKEYWQVRKYYENRLIDGENKILYLFYLKGNLIIAELIIDKQS